MKLERKDIELILPHRGRALLLDNADVDDSKSFAIGYLTVREEHCEGHFPNKAIMRGVDRSEMMAQILGLILYQNLDDKNIFAYLAGFDDTRYPALAEPGDLVRAKVRLNKLLSRMIIGDGEAFVGEKLIAEAKNIKLSVVRIKEASS
jgi:3-hydroxyacyl-[acyl-carrier-protein] dehydratase